MLRRAIWDEVIRVRSKVEQSSSLIDLSSLAQPFDRLLGATRYFQAVAVAIMLVYLVLLASFFLILPSDMARAVLTNLAQSAVSNPTTAAGYAMKAGAMAPFFMPLFCIMAAGALANFERPAALVVSFCAALLMGFVFWMLDSMSGIFQQVPRSYFYIHWIAVPLNLLVLSLVLVGVFSVWKIDPEKSDALRDGFGIGPLRTTIYRLFGLPAFIRHLGARRYVVAPLFLLSSFLLAASLYPFLFAGAFANNLVRINRSECVIQGANRWRCFEEAMRFDAFLFPVYVAVGFLIPFGLYIVVRRKARSMSITSMRDLMETDTRAPVLFLRPFGDDQVALPRPKTFSLFRAIRTGDAATHLEHQVLEEMTELGPVVAIGDRSKGSVPYGAARDYVPDDQWQGRVGNLIDTSRAIVIVLNDTPGVWWEVSEVLARGCVDRTLFIFPFEDRDRTERLWAGFCEALDANGLPRPTRFSSSRALLGVFRDKGAWRLAYTDDVSGTDTLALLRFFGTGHAGKSALPATSPRRYPFSIGLVVLIVAAFGIDDLLRNQVITPTVLADVPDGWQVQTVAANGLGPSLGQNLYFETSAANTIVGHNLGFARRAQASPVLLWVSPDGAVTRTVTLAVPERDRAGEARMPSVTPIALRSHEDGRIEAAISIFDGEAVKLELRELASDGTQVSNMAVPGIPALVNVQSGHFADDGSFYVSGQVRLADGSRGPFAGKLDPDRKWVWYYNDFGAVGWGNDIAVSAGGHVAVAVQLDRQFLVVGIDPGGEVAFSAASPFSEQFGAASSIIPAEGSGWLVAGYVQATGNPEASHTPIVAKIGQDGAYAWQTPMPNFDGAFVDGITKEGGSIYVAVSKGSMNEERSAIFVLDRDGEITETIEFFASGARSIRTITTAKDGAVWAYGLASNIPTNLSPIERMSVRASPWIIRVSRTSTDSER